ncbi:hypothetical protein [Roseovarius sp. BRH_c41]|uniref:hypothetical protein n=1 Tax=Roseovarius sp. BRH_c41 TaxID=1629709 RepID=UPI0005F233B0|nr:hypothetical protein [Roseovarius sp. BRH_c41]KJS41050.1 MAG: hypothetical protein VR71_21490 [Roseovarius sp. BRH_c41]KJS44386.1 MAG: hypothetical protein VR71_05640 [Roseovarius sp. BRH_c41]
MIELALNNLLLLGACAAGILLVAFFVMEEAPVARRVFGQFMFVIALPLLVLVVTPLLLLATWLGVSVPIMQALIAGLVIAGGWLTGAIFNELGKAKAKAERLRDFHKAIYAEIGNALAALWDSGRAQDYARQTIDRMQREPDYIPFIPREHHDHIFDAITTQIDVLPRQTIDAVVAYYSLVKGIANLADDMRGDRFQSLSQDRRILLYSDYLEMRRQAFDTGQFALKLIKAYAADGASAAERLLINSRDADLSARSQGSE